MDNTLTIAEIKRRGMAAIDEGLRHGPVHIVKRNKLAAVVLSEDDYQRLTNGKTKSPVALLPPPQAQQSPVDAALVIAFFDASALIYLIEGKEPFARKVRGQLAVATKEHSISVPA
ncbi:MAG: hypothetical protein IPO58_19950 [Betaproteobacteria bacterium]|nr:hypothetical protein [Betaproteobacteria bacterium]